MIEGEELEEGRLVVVPRVPTTKGEETIAERGSSFSPLSVFGGCACDDSFSAGDALTFFVPPLGFAGALKGTELGTVSSFLLPSSTTSSTSSSFTSWRPSVGVVVAGASSPPASVVL